MTGLDVAKNLGSQCPTCGNPISPGSGNKFQKETDYVGAGDYPLRFERYYNSLMRRHDRDSGFYGNAGLFDLRGNEAFHRFATMQARSLEYMDATSAEGLDAAFWMYTALESIGGNWRHTYQRSIRYVEHNNAAVTSAFAYRHDGRVLTFVRSESGFIAQADVSDRLEMVAGGWRYTSADTGEVETYGLSGELLSISSRSGQMHTLYYDSDGRLSSVRDDFGRSLQFGFGASAGTEDAQNRIETMTTPAGQLFRYSYGGSGVLSSVQFPDETTKGYLYAPAPYSRALIGIIDESGNRLASWTYDVYGQANMSEHSGGAGRVTVTYADNSDFGTGDATVVDSMGVSRLYKFSPIVGVAKVTSISQPSASGSGTVSKTYSYDARGNLTSVVDFSGRRTNHTYDPVRNLEVTRTEAAGTPHARTTVTQWHSVHRLPIRVDEPGRRTSYIYDASGNLLTKTVLDTTTHASRTWTYTYNSRGQILTVDGPRTDVSDITTYAYYDCTVGNECGRLQSVTNALGQTTTYDAYNGDGQPLSITDPSGLVTSLTYDVRQRVTARTAGGETTSFQYWPTGLLRRVTLPDSSYLEYEYDAAQRLTRTTDSLGNYVSYTVDAMGNRTDEQVSDATGALALSQKKVFDRLGNLAQLLSASLNPAEATSYRYDNGGNVIATYSPLGRVVTHSFDDLGRLTQVIDANNGATRYEYSGLDQLIAVTDPRNVRTDYTYNALDDLVQQDSPDTGTTAMTYDSAGNTATQTDARGTVATYAYDAANRVTSVTYPDQSIVYTYDQGTNGLGRLTRMSDASGSTAFEYDALGRLTLKRSTVGSAIFNTGYTYTSGRLTNFTTPSGQSIDYQYDIQGRVSGIRINGTVLLDNVLYEPFGPLAGWTWSNGTLTVRTFDLDGKLTHLDSAGLTSYTYFDDGNIRSRIDENPVTPNVQPGTTTFAIAATSNRLTNANGVLTRSYQYDAVGNTLSDGERTFTYNDAGRMVTATKNGITTAYVYNALGQRVRKSNINATTYFVYDEAGHLIGEYDQAGALIQEIVWLGDIPVASIRTNEGGSGVGVFYIHADHLNTPRKITRSNDNAIVWRWDSDPYGNGTPNEDPDGNGLFVKFNLRFSGQYADEETGLYQNYYRDCYDPQTGRYCQSDPIGLAGGINTFAYASGNPISRVDPFGLADALPVPNPGPSFPPGVTPEPPPARFPPGAAANAARAGATGVGFFGACATIIAGVLIPNSNPGGQCSDLTPRPNRDQECNDSCEVIEAQIRGLAMELRSRYLMAQLDPNDLYNRARTTPVSRRGGSYTGHRQQFLEKQRTLQRLIASADAKQCRVSPEDRLLANSPYPDSPVP